MKLKPTTKSSSNTKSFSLVELFVVVAILSTLASLLGPSLRQIVDDSRTLSCQKHLKAIGVNLFLYADDHTFFPSSYADVSSSPKIIVSYSDHLAPYDGRGQLPQDIFEAHNWYDKKNKPNYRSGAYTCPQETVIHKVKNSTNGIVSVFSRANYFPNSHSDYGDEPLGFTGRGAHDDWSQTPEFYPDPQETLALVEKSGQAKGQNNIGNRIEIQYPFSQSNYNWDGTIRKDKLVEPDRDRWHNNGWNYLFIDGHVKNLLPEETVGPGKTMGAHARGFWSYTPGD